MLRQLESKEVSFSISQFLHQKLLQRSLFSKPIYKVEIVARYGRFTGSASRNTKYQNQKEFEQSPEYKELCLDALDHLNRELDDLETFLTGLRL